MNREVVQVDVADAPLVVFREAYGDLEVVGWPDARVRVDGSGEVPAIEQVDGEVFVHLRGAARVRVPAGASVELGDVRGDVVVRDVSGTVTAASVAGDLAVRAVGPTTVASVAGDLAVDGVTGDLAVANVGADAAIRGVSGCVVGLRAGADVALRDVGGNVDVAAGADVALRLTPTPGGRYEAVAGADIACVLPAGSDVEVTAVAGSEIVSDFGPGDGRGFGTSVSTVLGAGGATLRLTAGARVLLRASEGGDTDDPFGRVWESVNASSADFAADFGRWAEDFSSRMREHAVSMAEQVSSRLGRVAETLPDVLVAAGMSADEAERISMRVQRSAERAGEQMDRKMREVALRVERKAVDAERRAAESSARRADRGRRPPRGASRAGATAVSEAERMAILRMVEEGKISVEDASRLLAALEGR